MYAIVRFQVVGERKDRPKRAKKIGVLYGPDDQLSRCLTWRRQNAPEARIEIVKEYKGSDA